MSRKSYFVTTAILAIIVLIGYLAPVSEIKSITNNIIKVMRSPYLTVAAIACAFIFISKKHYSLLMIGCAIITALIMQFFFVNSGFDLYVFSYRVVTFCIIVFALNLVKVTISR